MFSCIKNLLNIDNKFEFNFNFKNKPKDKKINLICFLKNRTILSYDDYIYVNKYDKLGIKLLDFLAEFEINNKNEKIFLLELEIKNCSSEKIKKDDFYQNDSLMVRMPYRLISISIDNEKTPKYINASIDDKNNENFYINFDAIQPQDSIYIRIIHKLDCVDIDSTFDIHGKTTNFDKPQKIYLKEQNIQGGSRK